jgi:hypothetical protein
MENIDHKSSDYVPNAHTLPDIPDLPAVGIWENYKKSSILLLISIGGNYQLDLCESWFRAEYS